MVGVVATSVLVFMAILGGTAAQVGGDGPQRNAPDMHKQVGVFLRCTGKAEPAEALVAAKSLGVDLVQISRLPDRFYTPDGAREFSRLLADAGLRAASVVVVFEGESYRDIAAVESTVGFRPAHLLAERMAYARRVVDFAHALNVNVVTFHMGVLPKDRADPTYKRMLSAVTDIARYAAERDVLISLETGQETGEELARFLDAITVARVGVNFDIANFVLYGMDDPPAALRRLLDRVTSIHVKDGLPPTAPGALGRETRLGEGRGDVKKCLAVLRQAGFTGPLIIENYVTRSTGVDPLEELRTAKAFIDKTLDELASTVR
jgi:L-ribulose-5-phosphate 3-epimerase